MALLSRFWVNVSLNIGLQYAAELLPTVIRAQGVNTIHIMGNVASIISPIVSSLVSYAYILNHKLRQCRVPNIMH